MTFKDGLEKIGVKGGKIRFRVRLVFRDPRTGKKHNTKRVIAVDSRNEALIERAKLQREFEAEVLGFVAKPGRQRFSDVADAWFATIDRPGTRISWGSHLRKLKAHFGEHWLDAIQTDELQRYLASLKRRDGKPLDAGTANSIRDVLVKIFAYAHEQGLRADNPAKATTRRTKRQTSAEKLEQLEKPKRRSLSADALPQFFAVLRQHHHDAYPLVLTQYALGCRFAEVSALRWEDVDLRTGMVAIRRGQIRGHVGPTKNDAARMAGLGPTALEVVKRHRLEMLTKRWKGYDELVFPRPPAGGNPRKKGKQWAYGTLYAQLKDTFRKCGYELAAVTHVARHTMNNLARREADERLIRKIVGHASLEQALTYTEAEQSEVIDLATRIEEKMKLKEGK